jgi:hypothetical protein
MSEDNTLLVTKDPKTAQALRETILDKFQTHRPWVCILVEEGGSSFRVTVDGPWGSRLPEEDEKRIKAFAKGFCKVTEPKEPVVTRSPHEEN